MSTNRPCNLTRLLRLITDVASEMEAQKMRDSMRGDSLLRQQHHKILQVATQPFSVQQSVLHLDQIDPELIAVFVEGRLAPEELASFEQHCWNSESLLREVISVWRMEHDPHCDLPLDAHAADEITDDPTTVSTLDVGRSVIQQPLLEPLDDKTTVPKIKPVVKPSRHSSRRKKQPGWLTFTCAAVFALALIGIWKWLESQDTRSGVPRPNQIAEDRLDQDAPANPRERLVDDETVVPPIEDPIEIPSPDKINETPATPDRDQPVVNVPIDNDSMADPIQFPVINPDQKNSNPRPTSPLPKVNFARWFDWSGVHGIAALRDATNPQWRGIDVSGSYENETSVPWVQVTTLPVSRARGSAENGSEWIVDANTSFRISQANPATADPRLVDLEGADDDSTPSVVCELSSGRVAIQKLTMGQILFLRMNQRDYRIEVAAEDTIFSLQRVGQEMLIGVFRGTATIGGGEINRRSWKKLDAAGNFANLRPEKMDAWYSQRLNNEVPETLRNSLNHSPNFLAQVADLGRAGTPIEQAVATQAILSCRGSESREPGDAVLRRMMGSDQELIRASLIHWLFQQCLDNPRFGMQMVKKVCQLQTVGPAEQKTFEEWFGSAARRLAYNDRLLNQLKSSLSNQSKPIVRQAAKFFLQRYLNDSLDFYDPISPGPVNGRTILEVQKRVNLRQQSVGN